MQKRAAATTLYLFPASQSPLVLVIRRGPSKCWHFLLWDRDTGIVTPGSWFQGMIYPGACDFSPRGDAMLILAYRGGPEQTTWTAFCRPPSVHAEVYWPQSTTRVGGGFFDGRLPIAWINMEEEFAEPAMNGDDPGEFGYVEAGHPPFGGLTERLQRDGWRREGGKRSPRWSKASPRGRVRLVIDVPLPLQPHEAGSNAQGWEVLKGRYSLDIPGKPRLPLPDVEWANWNGRGDLCFSQAGVLLRALVEEELGESRMVFDLNGLKPRQRPVTPAALHPSSTLL